MRVLLNLTLLFGTFLLASNTAVATKITQDLKVEQAQNGELFLDVKTQKLSGKMVLDTGSTGSVLDAKQLETLDEFHYLAREKGYGVGSKDTSLVSAKIQVPSLQVSGYTLDKVDMNVHALNHLGPNFVGIVGFDVLKRMSKGIHFAKDNNRLLANTPAVEGQSIVKLHHSKFGLPYVTVSLNDFEVGFILDTGSQHALVNVAQAQDYFIATTPLEGAFGYDLNGNKIPIMQTESLVLKTQNQLLFESKFLAVDLSSVLLNDSFRHHVIGIIGLNKLIELNTIINFSAQTVSFRG